MAVNSGTSGLHLGLLAAGIGPGDEVIVPSFTFAATANSVALTGATPVFADIEPGHVLPGPGSVPRRDHRPHGGDHAGAPVRPPGRHERSARGRRAARRQLFEDAAQAHGATLPRGPVGSFGTFAMFSLYPTKNMTSGEGGMVACADEEIARGVRLLRNQGMEKQYANELVGLNNRMTDIHAAIGRVQLTKVGAWTRARQDNAAWLDAHLRGRDRAAGARGVHARLPPVHGPGAGGQRPERDEVMRALREEHGWGAASTTRSPTTSWCR